MGIFSKLLGGQSSDTSTLDVREAFAAVLIVTIASDGHISDEEADSCKAVVNRMQLYKDQSSAQFSSMIDKLFGILHRNGPVFLLDKATPSLPTELRETAFAVAADLVFADGRVEDEEKALLECIQSQFGLADELALKIVEVILIKNRG